MNRDKIIYCILGGVFLAGAFFIGHEIHKSNAYVKELNAKTESTDVKLSDTYLTNGNSNKNTTSYITYFYMLNSNLNNITTAVDKSNCDFMIFLKSKNQSYLDDFLKDNKRILNEINDISNYQTDDIKSNLDIKFINKKIDELEDFFVSYNDIFKDLKSGNKKIDDSTIIEINSKSFELANYINSYSEFSKQLINSYKLCDNKGTDKKVDVDKISLESFNYDLLDSMLQLSTLDYIFKDDVTLSPSTLKNLSETNSKGLLSNINEMKVFVSKLKLDEKDTKFIKSFLDNASSYSDALNKYLGYINDGESLQSLKCEKQELLEKRINLNDIYKIKSIIFDNYQC